MHVTLNSDGTGTIALTGAESGTGTVNFDPSEAGDGTVLGFAAGSFTYHTSDPFYEGQSIDNAEFVITNDSQHDGDGNGTPCTWAGP